MDIYREIARLNPRQKEAVEHTEGPLLILAGAGSGKTRAITMRTAYLIYTGVRAGSVLAVTFTNKAAKEMKERVKSMVKGKNGTPVVSTFHSLCLKILRREIEHLGYRKDFTIYDTSEQVSLLRSILSDIKFYAGERRNLCVVGDDDQSIYGWRGADLGNILDFEKDFPGTVTVRLEQNYRSFGHILKAANGVIINNRKRMEKSLWTERGDGPKVNILKAVDTEGEAEG